MTKLYLLLMTVIFAGSCLGQDLKDTAAAKEACGLFTDYDSPNSTAPIRPHSDTDATVYLIQASNFDGACIGKCEFQSRLGMDGKWLGVAKGKSFLAFDVSPGLHHLCATAGKKKAKDLVALHSLRAEAGRTYFFGVEMVFPTNQGGGWVLYTLRPMDEDEGRMLIGAYRGTHLTQ